LSGDHSRIDSEACSSAITNDDGSVNGQSNPAAISVGAILATSAAAGIAIGIELQIGPADLVMATNGKLTGSEKSLHCPSRKLHLG
jgi:hypothetical protein